MRATALVFVVVCALAPGAPSEAGSPASLQNVRPRDATAELLLRFGAARSATFRQIVSDLERSNVVVYIDVRHDSAHPVGGGLNFVTEAQNIRWVRAIVDAGTSSRNRTHQDIVRLTAILAHELRHALEAAEATSMTDVREFERYFRQIGVREGRTLLDTLAARETGAWVASELRGVNQARGD